MTINLDKLRSPQIIFLIYVLICSALLMIFRFIFPGSEAPLFIYARSWRLIQGVLEVFDWFPALAFSALVIPFGFAAFEENYQSFSELFFKRIAPSVIIAISAAVVYGIVFFFALPIVKNNEENLRFTGELYHLAKKNIHDSMEAGEWYEASQFLNICDRIWVNSPELAETRDRIRINLTRQSYEETDERNLARAALVRDRRDDSDDLMYSPNVFFDQDPVDSTEAIEMSRTAFSERRFFDAHWLANLGARLAVNGSAQQVNARRLASEAWNMIASQAPNQREQLLFELHSIKLSGYSAMSSGRYIDAYYIFKNLLAQTPDDPDVANFLERSERGAVQSAFFIDEINLSIGEIINGPLFSLPISDGRVVLRFSTLKTLADVAYGIGFEYMRFDADNNLRRSAFSRYAKLLPFTLNGNQQILVMTHALDRYNKDKEAKSEWLIGEEHASGILIDINFDDFLLLTNIRRGLANLQINELFEASKKLETAGYNPQIFQAEILNRIASSFFFLPMAIFVLIIAWRFRAKTKPRYFLIILLPILPIVFNGLVFLYRSVFNTLGIWLIISAGFIPALVLFIVTLAILLFVSMITLAAQKS
jgi:hypothetical protein